MGALASTFWFLAFAVESAARVRTLALVEIFFAQLLSRTMFKQGMTWREGLGIALDRRRRRLAVAGQRR